jgi:phospholipase C
MPTTGPLGCPVTLSRKRADRKRLARRGKISLDNLPGRLPVSRCSTLSAAKIWMLSTFGGLMAGTAAKTVVANDAAFKNLSKIDHIVVLMMENRSFDHMLGFLSIDEGRTDIEGLKAGLSNAVGGVTYPVHPATSTQLVKAQDPSHGSLSVAAQIAAGKMSGFAQNYVATRPQPPYRGDSPGVVMAYHTAKQLPTYAYLADQFCVCDHWFCSVPGETMPNRCYAVTGSSGGHIDALRPPQPYNLKSFCRHLDDSKVSWRWYSHDYVPMLWLIDPEYGLSEETIPAYFNQKDVFGHASFLDHATKGDLPAVSWIDPNFIDLSFGPAGSNDDHPPSDLHAGQKLVLELFDAVVQGPAWKKTLLLITYDEHGGFYDHVPPPACKDDTPTLRKLGPRVPAIVVSPWVGKQQVTKTVFDHTSIIKTILARFCRKSDGTVPDMGARVRAAHHLGGCLTETTARPATPRTDYQPLIDQTRSWGEKLATHAILPTAEGILSAPAHLTDFQEEFLEARQTILAQRAPKRTAAKQT